MPIMKKNAALQEKPLLMDIVARPAVLTMPPMLMENTFAAVMIYILTMKRNAPMVLNVGWCSANVQN